MTLGLAHYLSVAAILFTLGVLGIFLNRKNVIVILMSVELILLSVNLNLVAFSHFLGDLVGQAAGFQPRLHVAHLRPDNRGQPRRIVGRSDQRLQWIGAHRLAFGRT